MMARGIGLTGPRADNLDARDFEIAARSELFEDLDPVLLEWILPRTRLVTLDPGEVLIKRGAANEFVYLILEGTLNVHLDSGDMPHTFTLGPGTCAGEISVIDGRGASAQVVAAEKCRLLSIDGETLWYLVANTDAAARNLLLIFSGRMRRDNDLLLECLRERQQLGRVASVDSLTGLHNRKWLDEMFARQMARCTRDDMAASLLIVDIDDFRAFVERYGPVKAERALQQLAAVLASCIRPSDLLARYDNEAFAMLLPFTGLQQSKTIAERVRQAVDAGTSVMDGPHETTPPLTVSIGFAELLKDDTLATFLARAEADLRQAKAARGAPADADNAEPGGNEGISPPLPE